MSDRVKAWQCMGCGRLESSETCIGICQDRPVEFVYAFEHEAALAKHGEALALLRQLAWSTPREGDWERSYRELQARARKLLAA